MQELKVKLKERDIGSASFSIEENFAVIDVSLKEDIDKIVKLFYSSIDNLDIAFEVFIDKDGWGAIVCGDFYKNRYFLSVEFEQKINIPFYRWKYLKLKFLDIEKKELAIFYPGSLDFTGNYWVAIEELMQKDYLKALHYLDEVPEGENIYNFFNLKGFLAKQLHRFSLAQNYYRTELENFRFNNICWSNLAILYRQVGEMEAAIDCFRKSLLLDPLDMEPLFSAVSSFSFFSEKLKAYTNAYFYGIYLFYREHSLYPKLASLVAERMGMKQGELERKVAEEYKSMKELLEDFYRVRKFFILCMLEKAKEEKENFLRKWEKILSEDNLWTGNIKKFFSLREQIFNG